MPFQLKKDPSVIHIMGTGSGWELSPEITTATVYCLNDFVKTDRYRRKMDRLFIMDILDEKPQVISNIDDLGEIIARINQMRVPLVAPYRYAEIPLSEAFPLEECVKQFGHAYFTNTICYMIAYALLQKPREIHIFGVNQAGSHEYNEERGGVEYWIGQAIGRGVKVFINGKQSQLLKYKGRYGNNILYGYLLPYEQVIAANQRFGEPIIRQLFAPVQPYERDIRTGRVHTS